MPTITTAQCLGLVGQALQQQCAPPPATAAALVANPDQLKFDALAASFGGLAVAVTIGAVVIGVLALVVTIAGYQWGKVVVREAKEDARATANDLIQEFLRTDARDIVLKGAMGLQPGNSDLNATSTTSDQIGEVA